MFFKGVAAHRPNLTQLLEQNKMFHSVGRQNGSNGSMPAGQTCCYGQKREALHANSQSKQAKNTGWTNKPETRNQAKLWHTFLDGNGKGYGMGMDFGKGKGKGNADIIKTW